MNPKLDTKPETTLTDSKTKWLWTLGIALTLIVLFLSPFLLRVLFSEGRFGMMGYGYGWHMPMMYAGYGMMGIGMFFMWLIPFGLLIIIGLGIALLFRQLKPQNQ